MTRTGSQFRKVRKGVRNRFYDDEVLNIHGPGAQMTISARLYADQLVPNNYYYILCKDFWDSGQENYHAQYALYVRSTGEVVFYTGDGISAESNSGPHKGVGSL